MPLQFRADAQVLFLTSRFGIYVHIPFCHSKCNYCSFYSLTNCDKQISEYCDKIISQIKSRGRHIARPVCSVYIGGGTPSLIGGENIAKILSAVRHSFTVTDDAEITVEANPDSCDEQFLKQIKNAGCNRLSIGLQSANSGELKTLGRIHTVDDVKKCVSDAQRLGFNNISVDLMLGLPHSTLASLNNSIDFALSLDVQHISAYILKVEPGTPFECMNITLPDDDSVADQYLFLCDKLKQNGYMHYEVSNFSKQNFQGVHNTNYWKCREYLGFGPAAHSFMNGERFYHNASLKEYMQNSEPIFDGIGGTAEEYVMLGLRISDGIYNDEFRSRFGTDLPENIFKTAKLLQNQGLCTVSDGVIALTDKGMLVSNSIINSFLGEIDDENL